jgi:hypothetical protein
MNLEFVTTILTFTNIHGVITNNTLLNTSTTVRTLHLANTVRCETKLGCSYSFEIHYYVLNLVVENQCTEQERRSKFISKIIFFVPEIVNSYLAIRNE